MSDPTFHFLNPFNQISGDELPTLLGRFVVDRWNPMIQGSAPKDPSTIIKSDFIAPDLDYGNAEMFITDVSRSSNEAAVAAKSLSVRGDATHEGDVQLSSVEVIRRSLKDAPDAFAALMADAGVVSSVGKLMRQAKTHTVWMITAVLFTSGPAHIKTNAADTTERGASANVTIPKEGIEAVGTAAAGGVPVPATGDVEVAQVSAEREKKTNAGFEADMESRRVFAVQYWRCEDASFLDRLRGRMTLQSKRLETVDTGHKGLGDNDENYFPELTLGECQYARDADYEELAI